MRCIEFNNGRETNTIYKFRHRVSKILLHYYTCNTNYQWNNQLSAGIVK